ncbi:MAG TPA: hypothetical protein VGK90_05260 [Rhizomicrobium sp.]|jgi:D-alanine-D-alanine ligase-like ATP-grasp enzyme
MSAFRHVAVLLGGRLAERDVSLVSGRACAHALRPEGFETSEIDARGDIYEAKYAEGGSTHVLPARVYLEVAEEAMHLAVAAHRALGCRGVSRADFRFDDTGGKDRLVLLEVNTQPGMTPTSLVPEQARHAGMSFGELVRWILEDASCDR